jgi:hypothetical protein
MFVGSDRNATKAKKQVLREIKFRRKSISEYKLGTRYKKIGLKYFRFKNWK